jgi:hypothetical protein
MNILPVFVTADANPLELGVCRTANDHYPALNQLSTSQLYQSTVISNETITLRMDNYVWGRSAVVRFEVERLKLLP